jgi:PAS domain S-box-containing protein
MISDKNQTTQLPLEYTELAYIEWDKEYRVLKWNKGSEDIFGFSQKEALGQSADFIFPHSDKNKVRELWESLLLLEGGTRSRHSNLNKSGKLIHCEWFNTPLRDQNKNLTAVASMVIDITESERNQQQLSEEREFTKTAIDAQMDTFVLYDPHTGKAIQWNRAFARLSGYTNQEIAQLKIPNDFFSTLEIERSVQFTKKVIRNGSGRIVMDMIRKNGIKVPMEFQISAIFNGRGKLTHFISIGRDLTDKKRIEEVNRGFDRLIDSSINEIYIFNANNFRFSEVNKGARENLGYSMSELIKMTPLDIKPEITLTQFQRLIAPLRKGQKKTVKFQTTHQRKDGSLYPVEVYLQLMKIGEPVFVAFIMDITDRIAAEQSIQEGQAQYKSLFNQIADPIVIFRQDNYRFLDCNEAAIRIYGYSKQEFKKMTPHDLHPPEDLEKVSKNIDDKTSSKPNEYYHITKSGKLLSVEIHTQELVYQKRPAWISIIRDISNRKVFEQELKIAKERAEESDRLKSAFLANMSHEIRTPMNAILGFSELLKDINELTTEERGKAIQIINNSGEKMLALINDLIDISKIEAGEIAIHHEGIAVSSICNDVYMQFSQEAKIKNIDLQLVGCSCEKSLILHSDPNRISQILSNLVKNSIKFTPKGYIRIGCRPLRDSVEFFVDDSGIGIPEEQQIMIFDRFTQLNNPEIKGVEGTGLGLSICKALVEKLGGSIGVDSIVGQGSRFYFTIPT